MWTVAHGENKWRAISCGVNTFGRLCRLSAAGRSFERFQNSCQSSEVGTVDCNCSPLPCDRARNGCAILTVFSFRVAADFTRSCAWPAKSPERIQQMGNDPPNCFQRVSPSAQTLYLNLISRCAHIKTALYQYMNCSSPKNVFTRWRTVSLHHPMWQGHKYRQYVIWQLRRLTKDDTRGLFPS